MNSIDSIDLKIAKQLIDFSGGESSLKHLAEVQIEGAVALHNMIANPDIGFAYLADEVGMGKTYIALGVVAILRYFNPMLRVLYICPSRNVQDKWLREYRNFVRTNVRVNQGKIKTPQGFPATPYKSCRNVVELLKLAASGYWADCFIGMTAFSIGLSNDPSKWKKKIEQLEMLVPIHRRNIINCKADVKEQYVLTLNYILPTFDLVVIDEAHNFKHDFRSSDRNWVLSGALGLRNTDELHTRAQHALLLSATPYDRDLTQLQNQLKMVGRSHLMSEITNHSSQEQVRKVLKRFLIRRLNSLNVNQEKLTRNMYRREWRKGDKAEITLETDEQKLVTALVQKKVGELLTAQSHSASFQAGLLASFESFAESTKSPPVEFDGDLADKLRTDAKDRHVIGRIADSYVESELGRTLPHPKMDGVTKRLTQALFEKANKQLVFVRRIKSVNEIKNKLDDAHNEWISKYTDNVLSSDDAIRKFMKRIYKSYLKTSKERDDVLGGERELHGSDGNESPPAKNDTFFSWFYRGKPHEEVKLEHFRDGSKFPTPDAIRNRLISKKQTDITLMEPNWAIFICKKENLNLRDILDKHGENISTGARQYISGQLADDKLDVFQACQTAFIKWLIDDRGYRHLVPLYEHIEVKSLKNPLQTIDKMKLIDQLTAVTLYSELAAMGMIDSVLKPQSELYSALKQSPENGKGLSGQLDLFDIHKSLMSFVLRTGHGIIDLYLARLKQGPGNLTAYSRAQWIRDFVKIVSSQKESSGFSTYFELVQLAENLDLVIKNNLPEIRGRSREEYSQYIRRSLSPVSPIIGATGQSQGRASLARKFRMPGYPLALITTDVFQEGEDLHTFCDSVVHYGLSGLPVCNEQKVGRVDRVSSKAERRLLALERPADDEDFIQVTFPYVKETLETLQIRQLCKNYNEFIESLHDVGSIDRTVKDSINLDSELASREEIPGQILSPLKSPFEAEFIKKSTANVVELIEMNQKNREEKIEGICKLLSRELGEKAPKDHKEFLHGKGFEVRDSGLFVNLTSAKASGELLLSLTRPASPANQSDFYRVNDQKMLMELMRDKSWSAFHRTLATETTDGYKLQFNSEMLVRDAKGAQLSKIKRIFERMEITHDPNRYESALPCNIEQHLESIAENASIPIDRFGKTRMQTINDNGEKGLKFIFGGMQVPRFQRVSLRNSESHLIFLSDATSEGHCINLSVPKVIEYTWIRNRHIDLVEFVMNPEWKLVGRVVHPIRDMELDEFIYCAYTLAVETDRLEYLLSKEDIH